MADSVSSDIVKYPFENIALSFSGGGFRAASFALGTLSYFDHLKVKEAETESSLLRRVTYMSSASGGTIATALYALMSVEETFTFGAFYKKLFTALDGDALLARVLIILEDEDKLWESRKGKQRNFINAFALAYDEILFDGQTLSALQKPNTSSNLYEVCFNTTEFYRGLLFRQAVKLRPFEEKEGQFLFGNFLFNLDHNAAGHLKLSDVLAASSCFPGGFEPIAFPSDFIHSSSPSAKEFIGALHFELQTGDMDELKFLFGDLPVDTLKANRDILLGKAEGELKYVKLPNIGFMDGGISDNIGIESMMKANDRRSRKESAIPPFDFMMTNDVGSQFMDSYQLPENKRSRFGFLNVNFLIGLFTMFLLVGIPLLIWGFFPESMVLTYVCVMVGSTLSFSSLLFFSLLFFAHYKIVGATEKNGGLNLDKNFSPVIIKKLSKHLRKINLDTLIQMVKARSASLIILNTDVFLKRVRQLLYNDFFDSSLWNYKVKGNRAYDLALSNDAHRKPKENVQDEPTPAMRKVAEIAFTMGTTLWFDQGESKNSHKQACIIASGQFTTCYNLLEYVQRVLRNKKLFDGLESKYQERLIDLETKLKKDYRAFQKDPFFLYNQLGHDFSIENFMPVDETEVPFPETFKNLI